MVVKYKKNGNFEVEFNQFFKSVDDLKKFIKEKNEFINVDKLEEKIAKIYNELTDLDYSIKYSILDCFIVKKFNFKHKRPNNINFWLERGYGINEFNKNNGKTINELGLNIENTFKYGKFKYNLVGVPKCNLCNSELNIEAKLGRYDIKNCTNLNCASHNNKEIDTIRQLAFIPINLFKSKNKRINVDSKLTKEYWLLKNYSYFDTLNEIKNIKNKIKKININTFDYYKLTTDKDDDEINKVIRAQSAFCIEYWVNKNYSIDEAKIKISKTQKENSNKFIDKKSLQPEKYSAVTETQLGYWLNKGYSEYEANKKLAERQSTFSLEKCVEKYGEEKGKKKFTERQHKWSKSLSTNGKLKIGFSKISQDLFNKLLETYDIDNKNNIYFATHNKEFTLQRKDGGLWLYDFTDVTNKKIIEFHGDMYHANPKKYKATDYPHPFRKNITAQEIWDKDKKKLDVAIKESFEVLIIWDSEYRWGNKQEIINKCINFLKNGK